MESDLPPNQSVEVMDMEELNAQNESNDAGEQVDNLEDKKWSSVWKHYLIIDGSVSKDGKMRAECLYCKKASYLADSHYGTTNMNKHLLKYKAYAKHKLSQNDKESPHMGKVMYSVVIKLLQEWGIENKIFSITLDNASSNDKMQDHMKSWLVDRGYLLRGDSFFHVRCGAHVLNLIVQDGLKVIDPLVYKIRESVKYVKWSQRRKELFRDCVGLAGIKESKALWLDVPTRWNSTYFMLYRAMLYRNAFKELSIKDPTYIYFPMAHE